MSMYCWFVIGGMKMENVFAVVIVMLFLFVGEWVSTFSKAYIPSVFITAVLFLIGYWTIIPKNITVTASFNQSFINIVQAALLVHMGTLMNLKTLIRQWKAVVIAISGIVGTVALAMGGGLLLFNWHTVIASVPPLTGGIVAAFLMTDGLKAQHITALVSFPVSMFVIHSIIGYPLTAFLLKREGNRLVKQYRGMDKKSQEEAASALAMDGDAGSTKWINLPDKYKSSAFQIFLVMVFTWIAEEIAALMNGVVNQFIICLIIGVIAHQLGLLEDHVLEKAGVFNWFMYGLLAYIFSFLNEVTPRNLLSILIPIVTMILLGILGMFLASAIWAKPLGYSREMAFASSLTALFGFPSDYIVTNEAAKNVGSTPEEHQYVLNHTLPKMLVGGFATVSVASVIIASIFLKLL